MATEVFVDTGAWFALQVPDDRWHVAAAEALRALVGRAVTLVTTNWVVGETYSLLTRTHGTATALAFADGVARSVRLSKIHADESTEQAALGILRQYDDQRFSFVDAVSFAVMRRRRIRSALAFDQHFATAGFNRIPGDEPAE